MLSAEYPYESLTTIEPSLFVDVNALMLIVTSFRALWSPDDIGKFLDPSLYRRNCQCIVISSSVKMMHDDSSDRGQSFVS
jgi:hypothetical protein